MTSLRSFLFLVLGLFSINSLAMTTGCNGDDSDRRTYRTVADYDEVYDRDEIQGPRTYDSAMEYTEDEVEEDYED